MVEDKSRLNNYSTDFLLDKQQQQIKIFPFCILTRMPISKERYGFSQTFIKENITILYLIHLLVYLFPGLPSLALNYFIVKCYISQSAFYLLIKHIGTRRMGFAVPHVEAKMKFMFINIKNSLRNI